MAESYTIYPDYSDVIYFLITDGGSIVDLTALTDAAGDVAPITKAQIEFYRKDVGDTPTDSFNSTANASNFDITDAKLAVGQVGFRYTSSDFTKSDYIPTDRVSATSRARLVLFQSSGSGFTQGKVFKTLQVRFSE